jgi:quinol monooxygenase YgiN
MTIFMTAQWKCKPGAESKIEKALRQFVAAVKENEPDTRLYTALQQAEDPTSFMTYFIFENAAAQEAHRSTDWVKEFTSIIYPENVGAVIFTEHRLIASTKD